MNFYLVAMRTARLRLLAIILAAGAMLGLLPLPEPAVRAATPPLSVAGDAKHLWIARPGSEGDTIELLHRGRDEPPGQVDAVTALTGRLAPHGIAADGDRLWLIFSGHAISTLDTTYVPHERRWSYRMSRRPPLPRDAHLRGFAARGEEAWALIWAKPSALKSLTPPATQPRSVSESQFQALQLGLPPSVGTLWYQAATQAATQPTTQPATQPATQPNAKPGDHLLHLRNGRWRVTPLPHDWPANAPAGLLLGPGGQPTLLAQPPGKHGNVRVYRLTKGQWHRQTYDLRAGALVAAVTVKDRLVAAMRDGAMAPDAVRLIELLPSKDDDASRINVIGTLSLHLPKPARLSVNAYDGTVVLLGAPGSGPGNAPATQPKNESPPPPGVGSAAGTPGTPGTALNLWWTRMTLDGKVTQSPARLELAPHGTVSESADVIIMMAVFVVTLLGLLLFSTRGGKLEPVALPPTLTLAGIAPRTLAAIIDLVPPVMAVLLWYELSPTHLAMRWPGISAATSWWAIQPGVVAIGLFVAYTTVAELLTRRTIGKALLGLKVTSLTGERPRLWQLLVRNILKSFDLVAWPLLLLIALGPGRQRLGDLAGKTVVASKAKETKV